MQLGVPEFTLLIILLSIVVGSNFAINSKPKGYRRNGDTRH